MVYTESAELPEPDVDTFDDPTSSVTPEFAPIFI